MSTGSESCILCAEMGYSLTILAFSGMNTTSLGLIPGKKASLPLVTSTDRPQGRWSNDTIRVYRRFSEHHQTRLPSCRRTNRHANDRCLVDLGEQSVARSECFH